jgi:glycosyltransferase involved in cell wall biosynthesis
MKVLLVSPFLPHPGVRHAGGKLVHFLYQQLTEWHEVTLVTRFYPDELEALTRLRSEGRRIEALPAPGPWFDGGIATVARTVASYRSLVLLAERLAEREAFDVCQVEFTETGYFWRSRRMPPAAITCHDLVAKRAGRQVAQSEGQRRVLGRLLALAQTSAERRALRKFAAVFFLSPVEAGWCRRLYPEIRPGVLRYPGGIGFAGLPRREIPGRVVFVGALSRPQNIEALRFLVREVWPTVVSAVPDAELVVVGSGAPEYLVAEMTAAGGVRVAGDVESVEPAYCEAAVLAAPILTGGGIIVKILDALAAGVPVVTTPYGNEGIEAAEGGEILVATEPAALAGLVVRLLRDAELRRAIGDAGRRHVERRFPRSGVLATLDESYHDMVGRTRNSAASRT